MRGAWKVLACDGTLSVFPPFSIAAKQWRRAGGKFLPLAEKAVRAVRCIGCLRVQARRRGVAQLAEQRSPKP